MSESSRVKSTNNVRRAMKSSAKGYARRGFPVFPVHNPVIKDNGRASCSCPMGDKCENPGKHPNPKTAPHGFRSATTDLSLIEKWWTDAPNMNIGLRTGRKAPEGDKEEGCGYIVLDVDCGVTSEGREKHGDYQLDILEDFVGKLPETWTTTSGRGFHLWFKHPGGSIDIPNRGCLTVPRPERWDSLAYVSPKNDKQLQLPDLQIRGDGGYVVGAPSIHYSGSEYTWKVGPRQMEDAAPVPPALLAMLVRAERSRPIGSSSLPDGVWPEMSVRIARAKSYLEKMTPGVSGNGGHTSTFRAAVRVVRGFCLPMEEAYQLMMDVFNPRCSPPWSPEEILHKVEDAFFHSTEPWGFSYDKDAEWELEREIKAALEDEQEAKEYCEFLDTIKGHHVLEAQAELEEAAAQAAGGGNEPPPNEHQGRGNGGGRGDNGSDRFHQEFITGSEIELAQFYRERLERDGRIVTHSESFFWHYCPVRGIWEKLDEKLMESDIGMFDGCPIAGSNRLMKVSSNMCAGAIRAFRNRYGESNSDAPSAARIYHFKNAKNGIAFRNGFLRINIPSDASSVSLSLQPHSPANMARFYVDQDWSDETMPSPILNKFLDNLFFDVLDPYEKCLRKNLIQEFVGVMIAGVGTQFQKYLLIKGNGGNGKSQLLKLIQEVLGKDKVSSVTPHRFGDEFQMRAMIGMKANIADDIPADPVSPKALSEFRKCITGDRIHTNVKHKDHTSFFPEAAHIYSANELFDVEESTEGHWRRCMILPMTANFEHRPDLRVRDAYKQVIENEHAQIIQWAIHGLIRLIREQGGKFSVPQGAIEAKEEWKEGTDPMYRFLATADKDLRDELKKAGGISGRKFYEKYVQWFREEGAALAGKEWTITMFGRKAKSADLLEYGRNVHGQWYAVSQKLIDLWAQRDRQITHAHAQYERRVANGGTIYLVQEPPSGSTPP